MKNAKLKNEIIKIISENGPSIQLKDISKFLKIKSDTEEYFILKDILNQLVQENVLHKSARRRYSLNSQIEEGIITGRLKILHNKGVIETEEGNLPNISIKINHLNTALDGDLVKVRLLARRKSRKPHGEVIEILERSTYPIVGTLDYNGYFYFIIPDEERFYIDFLVPDSRLKNAKIGDKVSAKLLKWDDPLQNPTAEIIEVFGKAGSPKVEYDSIIREFDLPTKFPQEVIDEAKQYKVPANRKVSGRLDLRNKLIITIDPYDAKDFDDALSLDILDNGNYLLGVHIADVSYYVKENSSLDIEARFRGNSIYLVDRVIPMLPEELSNEICSLKPNVPRFAYSIFIELTNKGDVVNYEFFESLIKNQRRYNYDEALEIIETEKGDNAELLICLYKLSQILRQKRFQKGGINFQTIEYKFVLDENKFPIDVKIKTTTKSTSLVEECMLLANQCVANFITKKSREKKLKSNLPFLYRVHEAPDPLKIKEVFKFISTLGYGTIKNVNSSKEINKLLDKFNDKPEKTIVNQVLIRSMAKAIYSHVNIGHYGLGFNEYTHFTSPIRRYPDLVVHRVLKEYIKDDLSPKRIEYLRQFMKDVGQHTTNTERLAMEAERASVKFTHTVMAQKHIGNVFNGIITGVVSFGLFVQLENIYTEGLLHIRDLDDDYYIFDEPNYCLIGKSKKKKFSIGQSIKVKIVKVNVDKRTIDLIPYKEK